MVDKAHHPSYLRLLKTGELEQRAREAARHLLSCDVCPRRCRVNRSGGEMGKCKTGELARVSSYGPHLGEEEPISGWRGSGTIFFTRCNLSCVYCQNFTISQTDNGETVDPATLSSIMLELQAYGCHNINLVSPSHLVPQILAAVTLAAQAGLCLPLVYNSGGYDSPEMLRLLDGVVDIYMPDMKYADEESTEKFSGVTDYPRVNRAAVKEMHRQVGDLQIADGVAFHGLLVRHLVLPNGLAGTGEVIRFLSEEISKNTYLNIMDQYRPSFQAHLYPELNRPITRDEYHQALQMAHQAGLGRVYRGYNYRNEA